MKLIVPEIRQKENSYDCGIAVTATILNYYGIEKTIEEIKKDIKIYEGVGTYVPQIGVYLIDEGFEVEIITMNPHIFTEKFKDKTQEELIQHFKLLFESTTKEKFKAPLKYFQEFLEKGGKIRTKIPTIRDIKEEIENKRPLGTLLTTNFLALDKPIFNFHFNTIIGLDEDNVYVIDPRADEYGGEQKYPIEKFMYAIHSSAYGDPDNASLIKIKKKK